MKLRLSSFAAVAAAAIVYSLAPAPLAAQSSGPSAAQGSGSLSPDRNEIESVGTARVIFIDYEGPEPRIDSRADIEGVGGALGRALPAGGAALRVGDPARYQVIRVVDSSVKEGLDADILILGPRRPGRQHPQSPMDHLGLPRRRLGLRRQGRLHPRHLHHDLRRGAPRRHEVLRLQIQGGGPEGARARDGRPRALVFGVARQEPYSRPLERRRDGGQAGSGGHRRRLRQGSHRESQGPARQGHSRQTGPRGRQGTRGGSEAGRARQAKVGPRRRGEEARG